MTESVTGILAGAPVSASGQPSPAQADLFDSLRRLDRRLEEAIAAAEVAYGPEAAADPYRGLHIGAADLERMIAREPGDSALQLSAGERPASSLGWLKQTFGLSEFDADVLVVALAPEFDLRYERLYAYLQDDVSLRRPTVDLAMNLLCADAAEKIEARARFAPDAPLVSQRLLWLVPDPNRTEPPLLSHFVRVDEQIVGLLLGQQGLDRQLATFCRFVEPSAAMDELLLAPGVTRSLRTFAFGSPENDAPVRLYFRGPVGVGKRRAAEAVAGEVSAPLLVADLAEAPGGKRDFMDAMHRVLREARLHEAILYMEGLQTILDEESRSRMDVLLEALSETKCVTIVAGEGPWLPAARRPLGVVTIEFPLPGFAERRRCWRDELQKIGLSIGEFELDALADRFRLTPTQIEDAVATARQGAVPSTLERVYASARAQSGHQLAKLARKIEPVYHWADMVLPEDTVRHLHELCLRPAHRHLVMDLWGFERKLSLGKGTSALFAGPSGTGKTMAAEVIANELQLDLYKVDLSGIVSKYIGETEKNLDRIFRASEDSNSIVFFDEADALFGRRSEVRDSHDRYANIEISYLLQKMEEYEGIAILASNLRQNLDDSFMRRLAFSVHFPFPDEESRERIWRGVWTTDTPLAHDLDFEFLACRFKLSGGNIRNIALAAAFLAAEQTEPVMMVHIIHAIRREYERMGKSLSEDDAAIAPPTAVGPRRSI